MSATYWIKLYHEILDDPKMATLPDRLYRRVIELFLLAGRYNKNGELPDARQIAWSLRISTDDCMMDLQQLESTGMIRQTATGWMVTKFAERQSPTAANERQRQHREQEQKAQYYVTEDVTNLSRNVTQNRTDTEQIQITDTEAEQNTIEPNTPQAAVVGFSGPSSLAEAGKVQARIRMAASKMCRVDGIMETEIAQIIYKYPEEWITDAIHTAILNRVPKWVYVIGILKRKAEAASLAVKPSDYAANVER
jgi:DNA-binding transcriptional regulator YhcF (GntR family)